MGIDASAIDFVTIFEAVDFQLAIGELSDALSVVLAINVVLEFVVDHPLAHDYVGPLGGIGLGALIELILPNQLVSLGRITLGAFALDRYARKARHNGNHNKPSHSHSSLFNQNINRKNDAKVTHC